ncbi:MAG: hypothetical protein ABI690_23695 [Chloroflexota bacterium]
MRRWTALLFIPLLWLLVQPMAVVQACSGGGNTPFEDRIKLADYVAKVRVIQTDDVGQNAFVQVERYLVGGPGPQILFLQGETASVIQRARIDRNFTGECLASFDDLNVGDVFYAILKRSANGTYHGISEIPFYIDFFRFPKADSQVSLYIKGVANSMLNESQFVRLVGEISGQRSALPNLDSINPTEAPLVVTTISSADYLLPLDGRRFAPITEDLLEKVVLVGYMSRNPYIEYGGRLAHAISQCPDIDCIAFHPLNTAFLPGDDRILLNWSDTSQLTGQAVLLSPAADAAAVWNHDTLNIYLLRYAIPYIEPPDLEQIPQLIGSVQLKTGNDTVADAHHAAWSPDSRQFAYSDAAGLWLWDALGGGEPRLLILAQTGFIPYARYFSPRGRYLAVTAGDRLYNLDLISGDELADGNFSSDDRLLLALTPTQSDGFYRVIIQQFAPPDQYSPLHVIVHQAAWLTDGWFLTVQCDEPKLDSCDMLPMNIDDSLRYNDEGNVLTYPGYSFDLVGNSYAAIVDAHTINFNGTRLDLSATLDSDIATIRFLPSLFYRRPG